jgi:ribosomal protein S18 acetylase RimI-like enzyme
MTTSTPGGGTEPVIRTRLEPGDVGEVVRLHGVLYAAEHGFDATFEAYVAGPLADLVRTGSPRERLWIAARDGAVVGVIGIAQAAAQTAQLRWFLVHPRARGLGLGRRLMDESVAFSRAQGYTEVILWTVSALERAARLYRAAGFRKVEERPGRMWGVDVVEERYTLELAAGRLS